MQRRTPSSRFQGRLSTVYAIIAVLLATAGYARAEEEETESAARPTPALAAALGVRFVEGSESAVILEREGTLYLVDLSARTVIATDPLTSALSERQETPLLSTGGADRGSEIFSQECASCHGDSGEGLAAFGTPDLTDFRNRSDLPFERIIDVIDEGANGTAMPAFSGQLAPAEIREVAAFVQSLSAEGRENIYQPADDLVYSLPTGRPLRRGAVNVNFTHRFAYNPAFSGAGLGNTLLGMDGFSISSFGFRFGVTDKLSVSAYRSPSIIGRPIEFLAAYNVLDEVDGHPLNAAVRLSIDGQDNFRNNFTTNIEAVLSRSVTGRAQVYAVPTASFQARRLLSKPGALENRPADLPGINTFSLGVGLAVNVRPTVAVVAEVIPTLYHGRELGIHRPAYAIGFQKQVVGHAFTLGVSNAPGTVVGQRAGTRATFVGDPSADLPGDLFLGFNLMRRLR